MPEASHAKVLADSRLDRKSSIAIDRGFASPDVSAAAWSSSAPAVGVSPAFAAYAERLASFESSERWRRRNLACKRILDCAVCLPLMVISAPLIALAAVVIKLVDAGPAFYSQVRIGARGERFRILKMRTMYRDADARLRSYLDRHPAARAEWEEYVKLRDDPRILPVVGRFLRKTSIDELPQLWNVLRGDMSLVGPRPFSDNDLPHYDRKFLALRETVRPGVTGMWQVFARGGDVKSKEVLDTFYLRNWSLRLDLLILLRTPLALLRTQGAC
jgi:lipopolysaccharide/colanic/teichoic acid biosynthesis glycosyltransferase